MNRPRSTLFWHVLVLLLCGQALAWAKGEGKEQPPLCEVTVHKDRAEFLFPVLEVTEWRWQRTETDNETLEYAWEVMIPADRPEFVFGIYLPKRKGAKQKEGNLKQLMAQTSWNAVRLVEDPKKPDNLLTVALPRTQLSANLKDGGVVLTLLDVESVEKFFSGRPKNVGFNLLHPDEVYAINCRAQVRYRTEQRPGHGDRVPKTPTPSWKLQLP
jgi:hypothetical protein